LNFQPKLHDLLQRKFFSYSRISIVWMIFFSAFGVSIVYWFDWLVNKQYVIYGFVIAVCLAYVDLFKRQATNLQKLAVPTFHEKVIPKIFLPLVFVLILYYNVSETRGLIFYALSFTLMLILVASYLFRHFKPA